MLEYILAVGSADWSITEPYIGTPQKVRFWNTYGEQKVGFWNFFCGVTRLLLPWSHTQFSAIALYIKVLQGQYRVQQIILVHCE